MAATITQRICARIRLPEEPGGCWTWTGALSRNGYGRFNHDYAHRIVYEMFVGPIPERDFAEHTALNHTRKEYVRGKAHTNTIQPPQNAATP